VFNGEPSDAFIPVTMFPLTTPSAERVWNTSMMFWLNTFARLKPGISREQAQAGMKVLWAQAVEAINDARVKAGGKPRKFEEDNIKLVSGAATVSSAFHGNEMADPLKVLALATALVLMIACANVATMLLCRATERRREIAVRLATGATRARIIRQLLSESMVLAAIGGALGVAFASFGVSALARLNLLNPELRFHPSPLVLATSAGITLITGILFGLAPAFQATRISLAQTIKQGGGSSEGVSRHRVNCALVAGQVALSLTLLVGANLFIRTLRNLGHANIGFDRENIAIFDVDPTNFGYHGERLRLFYDQMVDRARTTPGVKVAAISSMTPFGTWMFSSSFSAEGYQPKPGETLAAIVNSVSSGYFRTLGASILLGRDFRPQDEPVVTPGESLLSAMGRASGGSNESRASAAHVCIIDDAMSYHLFGDANPLGRHLSFEDKYTPAKALEIVGVVKNVHYHSVRSAEEIGAIYQPTWSDGPGVRSLEIRFTGSLAPVVTGIRAALRDVNPNVPVLRVRRMDEYVNDAVARERLIAFLASFFAIVALGLAAVGLYGVMAYAVRRRTREVGIRMALGARHADVFRMILREALVLLLVGAVAGLAGTLALTRLITSQLYGVAPTDGRSISLAIVAVFVACLAAAAIPARRATKVDPMVALRHE
jgi:predicted permease